MEFADFLQWLGVGGVALLTLYFTQKDKAKNNEQGLIEKMKEQLDSSDVRYDKLTERVDKLEDINMKLREENFMLTTQKNQEIVMRNNVEQSLTEKIELLQLENEQLKARIKDLEDKLIIN